MDCEVEQWSVLRLLQQRSRAARLEQCLRSDDWLEVMHREYLASFVRGGGAAVKVVVPMTEGCRPAILTGLASLAEEEGFVFASVDAASTKVHLIDKVFEKVAAQVPWRELASSYMRHLLARNGLKLPEQGNDFNLAWLAAQNEQEESLLRLEVTKWLTRDLVRASGMCQEFRFAMVRMCMGTIDPNEQPSQDVIEEWLRGELRLISALKSALIFQKIGRHNARHILLSLMRWIRIAGKNGLILTIDISRYMVDRRPKVPNGSLYYSRPATLEAYEVLRQLIDGTDDMEGCLMAVVATSEFLVDGRRGLESYDALNSRVRDEVYDRNLPNPLSSLVRISGEPERLGCVDREGSL
ncbi:MAG: hypothetical protein AUJ92_01410 [Armatimonadetes bacterium CG2_30_59_28]|nr:MAG: hypothetical protein AUJ92_01410 [Armatimonadetes bacterium CG2_30_59_28]